MSRHHHHVVGTVKDVTRPRMKVGARASGLLDGMTGPMAQRGTESSRVKTGARDPVLVLFKTGPGRAAEVEILVRPGVGYAVSTERVTAKGTAPVDLSEMSSRAGLGTRRPLLDDRPCRG
jgi:hypothetical protein